MKKILLLALSVFMLCISPINAESIDAKPLDLAPNGLLSTYQSDMVEIIRGGYDEIIPLAACDDIGCYTTKTGSYVNSVHRYVQRNYSDNLYNRYGQPCTGEKRNDDGSIEIINYTIANAGCAVTSMAMIINDMAGYSTGVITPSEVNDTVYNSCSFYAPNYENAYGEYITVDEYRKSTIAYNRTKITNLLVPLIDSDTLAIIQGTSSDDRTHYVVVNGYTYTDKYYDTGEVVRVYTGLSIVDPGGRKLNFNEYISTYSTITDFAVFSKS